MWATNRCNQMQFTESQTQENVETAEILYKRATNIKPPCVQLFFSFSKENERGIPISLYRPVWGKQGSYSSLAG